MKSKTSKMQRVKSQLLTVGLTLSILKFFKMLNLSWTVSLSPLLLLITLEAVFYAIGFIAYYSDKRKYRKL